MPGGPFGDDPPTLEWICFSTSAKYARHAGHLETVEFATGSGGLLWSPHLSRAAERLGSSTLQQPPGCAGAGANTKLIEERFMHYLRSARLPERPLQLYPALRPMNMCLLCSLPSRC